MKGLLKKAAGTLLAIVLLGGALPAKNANVKPNMTAMAAIRYVEASETITIPENIYVSVPGVGPTGEIIYPDKTQYGTHFKIAADKDIFNESIWLYRSEYVSYGAKVSSLDGTIITRIDLKRKGNDGIPEVGNGVLSEAYGNVFKFTGINDTYARLGCTGEYGNSCYISEVTIYYETPVIPEFTKNSMTLGGAISLNFYADLSIIPEENQPYSYVEFEVNGKKQTAEFDPDKMNSDKTAYGFTCMLDSVSMADDVKATLYYYDDEGEEQTITTTATAESYLNKFDESDGEKLWGLISSINDYGYYMQQYLSVHSGKPWTLGTEHKAMGKCCKKALDYRKNFDMYQTELGKKAKVKNIVTADLSNIGYALTIDADTSLVFTIRPQESYKGSVAVTVDGKKYTPKKVGTNYQVTIPGISAHKLGDNHTVTVKTTNGTSTFKASALSYANDAFNNPYDNSEKYAMCALYDYYKAAINYIG